MNSLAPAPSLEGGLSLPDLYDRFGSTAYSLALSITNDPHAAEHIVAASFATVWRRYEHEPGSILTFFADLMNSVRVSAVAHPPRLGSSRPHFAGASPHGGSLQSAVTNALGELRPADQQVLALAYFGGLAVNDIAARLQQPLTAVKAALKSALAHVRSKVADAAPETVSV
jgi:RNA polymerase sigma-70 factor (ECF subfamily)